MKYQYQELDANDGERFDMENSAWTTRIESDSLPDFFEQLTEMLNDEEYPSNAWTRILIDGVPAECVRNNCKKGECTNA